MSEVKDKKSDVPELDKTKGHKFVVDSRGGGIYIQNGNVFDFNSKFINTVDNIVTPEKEPTGEAKFICNHPDCGKEFKNAHGLEIHTKKMHKT